MNLDSLPTPCFVVHETKLRQNLKTLEGIQQRTGCKILLAQKAFSMFSLYPLIGRYLSGTAASGLYEARLGYEEMCRWSEQTHGKKLENHVYSPAYRVDEFDEILRYADHVVFNSVAQVNRFSPMVRRSGKQMGLRLNPECSTQEGHAIYDPCSPNSRLGTTRANFDESILETLDGFHLHTLCQQDSNALETTLQVLESHFGTYLASVEWLNLGGGHHITRDGYDIPRLEKWIRHLRDTYHVQIYLEPGEAVALNAGTLHTTVLETLRNGMEIAILDTSAACHMPDVLEMPYRTPLWGSGQPGEKKYTYRLGGPTCLAGDVIGDYSFDRPLRAGDRLIFDDMAIYTMVKTNTFNGMPLPTIVLEREDGSCEVIRRFDYTDFKTRIS